MKTSNKTNIQRKVICLGLLLALLCLLAGCGGNKLDGTYYSTDMISQTFTFSGNHVMMSAFGINANGVYEIKGNTIEITYSLFGVTTTWSQPFSRSGSSIFIGGTEFIKGK